MKILLFICLFCFSATLFADPMRCLKWTKICEQKEHCVYRDSQRNSCFRCIKPNHYGFHLYPQQIDRNTCNLNTVHYLQTMGYRCYQPKDAQICKQKELVKKCEMRCVLYKERKSK